MMTQQEELYLMQNERSDCMNDQEFKVGDKVISSAVSGFGSQVIGTVVKITEKRKDVVVDFGNYKETYDRTGWQKGGDIWYKSKIQLVTPEIEKDIRQKSLIRECKEKFKNTKITYEQAVKILEILESGETI